MYGIGAVALYLVSILWIGCLGPWFDGQIEALKGRDEARDAARREQYYRRERDTPRSEQPKVGDFLKFAFPIIRKAAPSLVASQLVSVQPMTGPVGGIAYYRPRYGEPKELRTALDDLRDALVEDDKLDLTDPARRCKRIAEEVVWEVFKDHPYSSHYGQLSPRDTALCIEEPSEEVPQTGIDSMLRAEDLPQNLEVASMSRLQKKWLSVLDGSLTSQLTAQMTAQMLENCAQSIKWGPTR